MENGCRVLGVLSGGDVDESLLKRWAASADRVIAADAGADLLLRAGQTPHIVVGDMDSIHSVTLESVERSVHLADQTTTDCDKLLALAIQEGHPAVTLIGVEGDLPDHVLATLHSAARSPLDVRLAYRRGIGWIVKPEQPRDLAVRPGRRLSLLAIEPCSQVRLSGVAWPLSGQNLSLSESTSISNRTEGERTSVTIEQGAALLFIEYPPDEMPVW